MRKIIIALATIMLLAGCSSTVNETDYESVANAYTQAVEEDDIDIRKKLSIDEYEQKTSASFCKLTYEFKNFELQASRGKTNWMEMGYTYERKKGTGKWRKWKGTMMLGLTEGRYYVKNARGICY